MIFKRNNEEKSFSIITKDFLLNFVNFATGFRLIFSFFVTSKLYVKSTKFNEDLKNKEDEVHFFAFSFCINNAKPRSEAKLKY